MTTPKIHKPIYLDYMSTTPVDPRVADIMQKYLTTSGDFGNSSSQHLYGYAAKAAIEKARENVASLLNTTPKSIIWTSGATEANNLALKGAAHFYKRQGKHVITCKTEHKSVIDTCKSLERQGFEITYCEPKNNGLIDIKKLSSLIRKDTIIISIMHVNNEIGVIQNISEIGNLTRSSGIIFHVDAAQSAGKIPINLQQLNVDIMSFSAHKVYGPKGVGALYIRQNPKLHLETQIHGGSQELGMRSGTLATHQIAGMGEAFRIANIEMETENKRILKLREKLRSGLETLEHIYINGSLKNRIAGNLNISFDKIEGETLTLALKDIAISSTSACNENIFEPSYVLEAIGVNDKLATNSIRFSIGRFTTEEEINYTIKHVKSVVKKLRSL